MSNVYSLKTKRKVTQSEFYRLLRAQAERRLKIAQEQADKSLSFLENALRKLGIQTKSS